MLYTSGSTDIILFHCTFGLTIQFSFLYMLYMGLCMKTHIEITFNNHRQNSCWNMAMHLEVTTTFVIKQFKNIDIIKYFMFPWNDVSRFNVPQDIFFATAN